MTLYEIAGEYAAFAQAVEEGRIPEEAIPDTFEALEGEFDAKADSIACLVKELLAQAEAIGEEERALHARRKSKENTAARLKALLAAQMDRIGRSRIETARNSIYFRRSTALVIPDEIQFAALHRELCRVEEVVTLPRQEIADRLKAGQVIPGASLETRRNLQIR